LRFQKNRSLLGIKLLLPNGAYRLHRSLKDGRNGPTIVCFEILMENPAYDTWYPTMAAQGTNTETMAKAYGAEAEMIGGLILAAQESANFQ